MALERSRVERDRETASIDRVHAETRTLRHTSLETDRPARRRLLWWIGSIAVLVVVAGGGWVIGQQVQSSDQAASRAAPPEPSWITADVERRVLAQTVILRGDIRPEVSILIGVPSSIEGSPVVTAIGVTVGDQVVEGARLIEVSGRPVFVLQGDVPVYRSLKPGMRGADVTQLQASLTRLGCNTTLDASTYGAATKACVARFYADAGYEPVPASPTELTDLSASQQTVVDAQTAIDSAQLALDNAMKGPSDLETLAATTGLGAAQRAYNDAVASTDAAVVLADGEVTRTQGELDRLKNTSDTPANDIAVAQHEFDTATAAAAEARRNRTSTVAGARDAVMLAQTAVDDLNRDPDVTLEFVALGQAMAAKDRALAAFETLQATTGATVAQGEVVFAPTLPARVQQSATSLGPIGASSQINPDGSAPSGAGDLATLAAGDLVVSMTLRAGDRGLVRVGMGVELLDEQSNVTYPATISTIADTQATGSDGQQGYSMVVAPDESLPNELAGVNIRVTITAASTDIPTLVVPLAAVSSAADGSTNVSVLPAGSAPGAEPVIVTIVAGLSADGFVSIEPVTAGALVEGDKVIVGR
jgi:hypothetical protein